MRVKGRVTRGTVASGEAGLSSQLASGGGDRRATRGSGGAAGPSGVSKPQKAAATKRGRGRPPDFTNKPKGNNTSGSGKGKAPAVRIKLPESEDEDDENHAPAAAGRSAAAGRATRGGRAAAAALHDDDDDERFVDAEDAETETEEEEEAPPRRRAAAPAAAAAAADGPRRRGRPVNPLGRFIGGPASPGRRDAERAAGLQPSPTAAARRGGNAQAPAQNAPAPAQHAAAGAGAAPPSSPARRLAEQGVRQADLDQLDRAKERGNTVRIVLHVELSDDLSAQGAQYPPGAAASAAPSPSHRHRPQGGGGGAPSVLRPIEVPALCEVRAFRRYINYYCHDKMPPAMQRLRDTLSGAPMHDLNARGEPNTLGSYGLSNGAEVTLTVVPPETEDQQLAVGAALAEQAEREEEAEARAAAGGGGAGLSPRRPGARPGAGLPSDAGAPGRSSRQGAGRWSLDEMEALVGGIEAWGLSWADVRRDPRLAARDGVNCKDKFRNMCLTVLQGRTERKVAMPFEIRERVTRLAEQYNVRV